ncbi:MULTISPECIES: hypothetical protein [unclassified Microcoleus]|uniref:hypothetical protein n=1 Tax=unclassified Microcoleus TaxID=2642155 RepID=UPI002FCF455F
MAEDVTVSSWYNNLGTTIQPIFNTAAMLTITPANVIFSAVEAYRESQEAYNTGTSVQVGEFINFVSPIRQDATPTFDSAGELSSVKSVTLRAKIIYAPEPNIAPSNSVTLI